MVGAYERGDRAISVQRFSRLPTSSHSGFGVTPGPDPCGLLIDLDAISDGG